MELCMDGGEQNLFVDGPGSFRVEKWEIRLVKKIDSLNFFTLWKVKI